MISKDVMYNCKVCGGHVKTNQKNAPVCCGVAMKKETKNSYITKGKK